MATLKMGTTTVLTDTTLANAVQDNVTRLGTVTAGTMNNTIGSSATFPTGHVIQMNSTRNVAMDITRSGNKLTPAGTGVTCVLPNDLQSSSKLFAQFSAQLGEDAGGHWAIQTFFTFFCNSVDVAPYATSTNNQGAGLGSASYVGDANHGHYMNANVSGCILFTPTGSGAARRTVELGWASSASSSYAIWLNRSSNTSTNYRTGGTNIVLMEIAQ
jgi:hypothetical protein